MDFENILFEDPSQGKALALVRVHGQYVILGLSLKENGDIDAAMDVDTARKVIELLQRAVAIASSN